MNLEVKEIELIDSPFELAVWNYARRGGHKNPKVCMCPPCAEFVRKGWYQYIGTTVLGSHPWPCWDSIAAHEIGSWQIDGLGIQLYLNQSPEGYWIYGRYKDSKYIQYVHVDGRFYRYTNKLEEEITERISVFCEQNYR